MSPHCHRCGAAWDVSRPPGRTETCTQCRADLKVCLNCTHFDRALAYQCRERRAEPVVDKEAGNFCEYFEFARRTWAGPAGSSREEEARNALKTLLG